MEMKNIGIVKEILGIVEYSLILCSGQIAPSIRLGETVRSWERIAPFIIITNSNQGGENQGRVSFPSNTTTPSLFVWTVILNCAELGG